MITLQAEEMELVASIAEQSSELGAKAAVSLGARKAAEVCALMWIGRGEGSVSSFEDMVDEAMGREVCDGEGALLGSLWKKSLGKHLRVGWAQAKSEEW